MNLFPKYDLRAIKYEIDQLQSSNSLNRDPRDSDDDSEDEAMVTESDGEDCVIGFSEESEDEDNA